MGSQCSATLAHDESPSTGCARLQRIGHCEEECDPCSDSPTSTLPAEHPLLQRMQQELDGSNTTPRTPRGPAPPWALEHAEQRDRTATGCTPPRSPIAVKTVPPGLPDEEAAESALALAGSFGPEFIQELFRQARQGDAARMSVQLQKVHAAAFSLLSGSGIGFADGGHPTVSEQSDAAAELTGDFLNQVRCPNSKSSLLGAATEGGIHVVQMLLMQKADPMVSDPKGNTPLHKAAEHGSMLTVLMLLDRMQAHDRWTCSAEPNADGETPEMLAALANRGEICHTLEVFRQMQTDAKQRQLGSALQAPDTSGHRISTGDAVSLIDLSMDAPEAVVAHAGVLLRQSSIGSVLVPNLFQRIPEEQADLAALVERVCAGLKGAEAFLLRHPWDPGDPGLDPALKSFVHSALLRSQWQKLRQEALVAKGATEDLEEFWQTHLSADAMAVTIRNAVGDTFQLLLTALWLYTREAWLRHLMDALASALQSMPQAEAVSTPAAGAGATGSTPECSAALGQLAPMVENLAPCMQLVQAALCWFEEANIHHTAVTYRPLQLPMLGLQKLVDRYVAQRKLEAKEENGRLEQAFWLSLGGVSFFSALSSRHMAIARLAKSRCNVLLIVRPDEKCPSFPKHMSLRGHNVDDSLFPLESIFRIGRITRTVSSELDVDGTSGLFKGTSSRWPVIVLEVYAANMYAEVMEALQLRKQVSFEELNQKVEEWIASAPAEREAERLYSAGLLFSKIGREKGGENSAAQTGERKTWQEKAAALLLHAAQLAQSVGLMELAAQALLAKVRLPATDTSRAADSRQALSLLKAHVGEGHPLTGSAKELVQELSDQLPELSAWAERERR